MFRDREKQRLVTLKPYLFSLEACVPGPYRGKLRDFCLAKSCSAENLHESVREAALGYFQARRITWHDGISDIEKHYTPSNHLCCSQSCCVNFLFPYTKEPYHLQAVLRAIGYSVKEVLPIEGDLPFENGMYPFVGFEWIGLRNYLGEGPGGRSKETDERTRGSNSTSADFAFRFRQEDGRIHLVLGEWKYTEYYAAGKSIQISRRGTDRLRVYQPSLTKTDCQIKLGAVNHEALFFDPFDQMMRLQLLASAMEREKEMDADIVSCMHVGPRVNLELMNRITSSVLASLGNNIHEVWANTVEGDRFKGVYTEDLLPILIGHAPDKSWAEYIKLRYGAMK